MAAGPVHACTVVPCGALCRSKYRIERYTSVSPLTVGNRATSVTPDGVVLATALFVVPKSMPMVSGVMGSGGRPSEAYPRRAKGCFEFRTFEGRRARGSERRAGSGTNDGCVARSAKLAHASFDQPPHLFVVAEFGEERAPWAGVSLVHRVCQHGLHHRTLLRVRFPEPALEVRQDGLERRVVPLFGAGVQAQEVVEDGCSRRAGWPAPERHVR